MSLFSALHSRPPRGRSRHLCLGVLLLATVALACASPALARSLDGASRGVAVPRASAAVAQWTVIMYMCGDNNLAPTVTRDLDQQAARSSPPGRGRPTCAQPLVVHEPPVQAGLPAVRYQ